MSFVQSSVWETRWILKVARWTRVRCTKINKSQTGIGALSFEIWTANLAVAYRGQYLWSFKLEILQSKYPQTWHSDADISDLGFFFIWFYFCVNFFSKPVGYTRTLYSQMGKNKKWAETFVWCLLLIFKVVYQDHLTQLLPFTWDFVVKGQRLVWAQVG